VEYICRSEKTGVVMELASDQWMREVETLITVAVAVTVLITEPQLVSSPTRQSTLHLLTWPVNYC